MSDCLSSVAPNKRKLWLNSGINLLSNRFVVVSFFLLFCTGPPNNGGRGEGERESVVVSKFLFLPSPQTVEINQSNKFITVSIFSVRHKLNITF